MSDNGTQFTSDEFRRFAEQYQFKQIYSSPHYPQSNGEAESAVKVAKRILKQKDIFAALMAYRSTPIEATGVSPAQLIMGRKIRTVVPMLPKALDPEWPDGDEVRLRNSNYKERSKRYYDYRHSTAPLPKLHTGDTVRIKTDKDRFWSDLGTVRQADHENRSYVVETPKGS